MLLLYNPQTAITTEAFQVNDAPKRCAVFFITTQQLRNDFSVLLGVVFQMVIPDDFVGAFNSRYKLSQAIFSPSLLLL